MAYLAFYFGYMLPIPLSLLVYGGDVLHPLKWVASRFTAQSFSPVGALRTLRGAEAPGLFSSPWLYAFLVEGCGRPSLSVHRRMLGAEEPSIRGRHTQPKHPLSTSSIDSPAIFILCLSAFIHRINSVVFCHNWYKKSVFSPPRDLCFS